MVVLADTPADQEAKGLTPDVIRDGHRKLAREHKLSDGDRLTFGTSELIFKVG